MKRVFLLSTVLILAICLNMVAGTEYDKASPFSAISWNKSGDVPVVKVNGKSYELLGINGESVSVILSFCKKNYGSKAYKRFNEDLPEVFHKMGKPLGKNTELFVRDIGSDKKFHMHGVPVTRENRDAVTGNRTGEASIKPTPEFLSSDEATEDLNQLQVALEERFAYLKVGNPDYRKAITDLKNESAEGIASVEFEKELNKIMGMFIDGHSAVMGLYANKIVEKRSILPFHLRYAGGRVVAIKEDGSDFLIHNYPYITKLDGISIEKWVALGKKFRAEGSIQYQRRQGLRGLRNFNRVRNEMGLKRKGELVVELLSEDLLMRRKVTLDLRSGKLHRLRKPGRECGILADNIGYLRISSFSRKGPAVKLIGKWMPEFKDTRALIVDVRGNGGGSREGLLALYPYLMSSKESPRVANVCAYRLFDRFGEDHLANRYVYPADSPEWSAKEKSAIADFMKTFTPQWKPEAGEFSKWHFLVMSRKEGDKRYHYKKPVIILHDSGCFSATDIFLGALKSWKDNVVLMGTPSGGGSARSQRFILKNSSMVVRCASMISFQPDGFLYDTNGINPDILVDVMPDSFREGGRDNVLEHAVKFINKGKFQL